MNRSLFQTGEGPAEPAMPQSRITIEHLPDRSVRRDALRAARARVQRA
ncbi:MAG TPA: hypothetical protein VHG28_01755 [Longimicrobiaceae bacterium]|nr:hypothetical protein [Longimicrobiaceae bacterium]